MGDADRGQRAGPLESAPRPCRRDPVGAAAAAVLDDPVRRVELDDRVSIQTAPRPRRDAEPRPGADPGRLDPGQVEVGEEVIGEGGPRPERSAIASKARSRGTSISISALTGPIGGAILCPARLRTVTEMRKIRVARRSHATILQETREGESAIFTSVRHSAADQA